MGSIVTSIGRAISGFFEKVKDFLPVLLLAAGVYLGYGYMTGFQSGGWPAIMNWGKSLISGVTQGETISAATAAADVSSAGMVEATAAPALAGIEAMPISPTDVTTTALTAAGGEGAALAGDVAETGLNFADMTNSLIAQNDAISNTWTDSLADLSRGFLNTLISPSPAAGIPRLHTPTTIPGVEVGATTTAIPEIEAGTDIAMTGTGPALETLEGPSYYSPTQMQSGNLEIPHPQDPTFPNKLAQMGKKAWNIYKNMWSENPGMAMWTTANVLKTIFALLDDSAEKESYARRHVMGFSPGGFDDMPAKYGGKRQVRGVASGHGTSSRRPSSGLKVGRLPEATASRTSAIDRKPAGIIGPSTQRTV
jgi:hypothetical protein